MNWTKSIILTIIIIIPFSIFVFWYQDVYRNAAEEYQNLYAAIGAGIVGIILHSLKYFESLKLTKQVQLTIDSIELLLLVISPTTASFTILRKQFPGDIAPILIIFGFMLGIWYVITLYRTTRKENLVVGRAAFVLSNYLYWSFVAILVFGAALPIIF